MSEIDAESFRVGLRIGLSAALSIVNERYPDALPGFLLQRKIEERLLGLIQQTHRPTQVQAP